MRFNSRINTQLPSIALALAALFGSAAAFAQEGQDENGAQEPSDPRPPVSSPRPPETPPPALNPQQRPPPKAEDEAAKSQLAAKASAHKPHAVAVLPAGSPQGADALQLRPACLLGALCNLRLGVRSSTEIHSYNNRDYRSLDESSDLAVINSDDRRTFGHTDVAALAQYQVLPTLAFVTQMKFDALWRDDSLGRAKGTTGDLNFFELYTDLTVFDTEAASLSVRLGRQQFEIGGLPIDYMLWGTADAITAVLDFKRFGRVRSLLFDVFGGNDLPVIGYQFYPEGSTTVFGLRGATNTYRSGAIYEFDEHANKTLGLTAKAYYFYASVGGGPIETSGADISYGGLLGNFRDADYQHLMGGRLKYHRDFGKTVGLDLYGEFARSQGVDRKPAVARDVNTDGNAFGGGAMVLVKPTAKLEADVTGAFYHFDGAQYASDGLEFKRGFVSFKGNRVGGLTTGVNSGWRPSAHLDSYGVDHTPQDLARSAGTQFLQLGVGGKYSYGQAMSTRVYATAWIYQDTSKTFLTPDGLAALANPPYGYTKEEFESEQRLGKALGQEVNVGVTQYFNEYFRLYADYGMFKPGKFYEQEVSRLAGQRETAIGGQATFWAFRFGGRVDF